MNAVMKQARAAYQRGCAAQQAYDKKVALETATTSSKRRRAEFLKGMFYYTPSPDLRLVWPGPMGFRCPQCGGKVKRWRDMVGHCIYNVRYWRLDYCLSGCGYERGGSRGQYGDWGGESCGGGEGA